jgi:hypothetical protein
MTARARLLAPKAQSFAPLFPVRNEVVIARMLVSRTYWPAILIRCPASACVGVFAYGELGGIEHGFG